MIVKLTKGRDIVFSLHDFPKGDYGETNKRFTDLIECDWYGRVSPRRLYDDWGMNNLHMLVDDEGLLKPNGLNLIASWLYDGPIMGNVIFVSEHVTSDGAEFCGMTIREVGDLLKKIRRLIKDNKAISFTLQDKTAN